MERTRLSTRLPIADDRATLIVLAVLTATVLTGVFLLTRHINPLRGDSAEYLYFDRSRTVGYPAFLALVRLLTGKVAFAVPLQMALLAGSLLFLAWNFHKLVHRPSYTLAFDALLLIQAGMWFTSAFLMSEALSTALVACWCAQLLSLVRGPTFGKALLLLVVSSAATMIRPAFVCLFLASGLLFMLSLAPRQRSGALLLAVTAAVASWMATPVAQWIVHGSGVTTSPFARGVLQHTLYCELPTQPLDSDSLLVEASVAPVRRYIASAPAAFQEQLRRTYSTPLRFGLIIPALGLRHHVERRSAVDPYIWPIARQRVLANPLCYVRSVANEYLRMTAFDTDPTSEDARRANGFMDQHPPVYPHQLPVLRGDALLAGKASAEVGSPPAGLNRKQAQLKVVGDLPLVAILPLRVIYAAGALVGLLGLFTVPIRGRVAPSLAEPIMLAAPMGIALHGALLLTAMVEIGFYRYLVPFWPLVCTLSVFAVLWVVPLIKTSGATNAR